MASYDADKYNVAGGKTLDHIPARAGIGLVAVTSTLAVTTGLAAADTINLMLIPAGATILEVIAATDADLGSTMTIDIGDATDVDRFIDGGVFTTSTGNLVRAGNATAAPAGHGYTYTAETALLATVVTAAAGTTDGTLKVTVIYNMQG